MKSTLIAVTLTWIGMSAAAVEHRDDYMAFTMPESVGLGMTSSAMKPIRPNAKHLQMAAVSRNTNAVTTCSASSRTSTTPTPPPMSPSPMIA